MTDKLLIKRELLERVVKADASNGASSVDLVDGWKAMEQIRAILSAPRQPEGEGLEVVAYMVGRYTTDQRESAETFALHHAGGVTELCRLSDHLRAIAELREECGRLREEVENKYREPSKNEVALESERDTMRQQLAERDATIERLEAGIPRIQEQSHQMRQQRDKLAGLLREVRGYYKAMPAGMGGRIDAALAEVK